MTNNVQRCPVTWCDQGTDRPHMIHERTYVTVPAVRIREGGEREERPIWVQFIVHGRSTETARPVLAMVDDKLGQWSAEMLWQDAKKLAAYLHIDFSRGLASDDHRE